MNFRSVTRNHTPKAGTSSCFLNSIADDEESDGQIEGTQHYGKRAIQILLIVLDA